MPEGIGYGPQAPGIDAILQALALGGQPLGNLAQQPIGINPSAQDGVSQQPVPTQNNPALAAAAPIQGDQIQALLEALLGGGAFNNGGVPVG